MLPGFPLPTDNLYKFTCFFGLALLITGVLGTVSFFSSELDRTRKMADEVSAAEAKQDEAAARSAIRAFENYSKIAKLPHTIASAVLGGTMGSGIVISILGALFWAKRVQVRDDRLAALQIEKLEAEIARLRAPPAPAGCATTPSAS